MTLLLILYPTSFTHYFNQKETFLPLFNSFPQSIRSLFIICIYLVSSIYIHYFQSRVDLTEAKIGAIFRVSEAAEDANLVMAANIGFPYSMCP